MSTTLLSPVVLKSVIQQGQGPAGPPGQSGANYIAFYADGPISGHRMVKSTVAGKVGYTSSSLQADANTVLGMTLNAASADGVVNVQTSGPVTEPTWNWTPNLPVFLGVSGAMTQTPPATGFQLVVGIATAPTTLVLGIKQPIIL